MIKKLGLIINPIAGMGGKVALKGTDGAEVLAAAKARGAVQESHLKAERALEKLNTLGDRILILTCSGSMGETLCRKMKLSYEVVYSCNEETSAMDTERAAAKMKSAGVDLLMFAGGDGTARNICQAVKTELPVIGIPAGVKIQSAVFAIDPESAGLIAAMLARGEPLSFREKEVVDLDEDSYRNGLVSATLYGYMTVPDKSFLLQDMKQGGFSSDENDLAGIADFVIEKMVKDFYYAIGSGSTAKCVSSRLGLPFELLGVDVIRNRQIVATDVTEEQLWRIAEKHTLRIVVSPIGGQGFIFGRGNHQFSSRVLAKVGRENIIVVAPSMKLLSIASGCLRVDCDNAAVSESLRGFYNVISGYAYYLSMPCK